MFSAREQRIQDFFSNNKMYEIPRNQRKYVWTQDNWSDLLEDFKFIMKQKDQGVSHFLGSIVLQSSDNIEGVDHFIIIDGQQRAMTLLILLCTLMQLFKEKDNINDFAGTKKFLLSTDFKNQSYAIIYSDTHLAIGDIVLEVCEWERNPQDLLRKVRSKSMKDNDALIYACFNYFYTQLSNLDKENPNSEFLQRLRSVLMNAKYVDVTTNTEEDSYTVFEILNARGQKLEDYDMIKNYLMRYVEPPKQEKVDRIKPDWSQLENMLGTSESLKNFFRHYMTHKYKSTDSGSVYKEFKRNVPVEEVEKGFRDIMLKAELYSLLAYPQKQEDDQMDSEERYIYTFFNKRRYVIFRPMLLTLLHLKYEEKIDQAKYLGILNKIFQFFVAYNVISEDKSNKIDNMVSKHASILENNFSEDNLQAFLSDLEARFPSKEVFVNHFKMIGWSKGRNPMYKDDKYKKKVKLILELFERHYGSLNAGQIETLEHILPDADGGDNHLIGNIIPLESRINANCENKTLHEKLPFYRESSFKMPNRIIKRYGEIPEKFNPAVRTEKMAEEMYHQILERK